MKILSPAQIRSVDQATIEEDGISSGELMERAVTALTRHFTGAFDTSHKVHIFSGRGNNGGDGLALARLLHGIGYRVRVYRMADEDRFSHDNELNHTRLQALSVPVIDIPDAGMLDDLHIDGMIIDALVGTGLRNALSGLVAATVDFINRQRQIVVAIDIPSGLQDATTAGGSIVKATYTYSFQVPKLSLLLPDNAVYTGRWKIIDIGLSETAIAAAETPYLFNTWEEVKPLYLRRSAVSHKGDHGHALLIAGAYGKAGAAVLAAKAAMRSGLGLLTMQLPKSVLPIIQATVPEAMCIPDDDDEILTATPDISKYRTVGIGPGIGTHEKTGQLLSRLLDEISDPMVIDADGLNLLSAQPELLEKLPPLSILTPHPGEFKRLAGPWTDSHDRLDKQRQFAAKYNAIVVLKGPYTSIARPDGTVSFNSSGNNGMATAGSGDTLTGLLTGLLAQGYQPYDAARFGVFLHGLAGDLAADTAHPNALIASDIIDHIGAAFRQIRPI